VEKNGEHVQKDNVVVRMALVVLPLNSVHFLNDVKLNMVNVPKVNVVNFGDHVQKNNIVVRKDTVAPLLDIVLLLKDVKLNMVNVQ